jgi:hypothetical protein
VLALVVLEHDRADGAVAADDRDEDPRLGGVGPRDGLDLPALPVCRIAQEDHAAFEQLARDEAVAAHG